MKVYFKMKKIFFILMLTSDIYAQNVCESVFNTENVQIKNFHDLGNAMTRGLELREDQADIFDVYRQMFFGTYSASSNGLKSVTDILKRHPELTKKPFREYEILERKRIYESPERLSKYIKSQQQTAGQIKNRIFKVHDNLDYWKKLLDYIEPEIPEMLKSQQLGKGATEEVKLKAKEINRQRAEYLQNRKKKFEKYLNRIISKANQDFLSSLENNSLGYVEKTKALFMTLKKVQEWLEKREKDTHAIRQAMVDIVFISGHENPMTKDLLSSKNGLDRIEGLRKVLAEASTLSFELGYPGHFEELITSLKIEFPTGLSKNENAYENIDQLEKETLQQKFVYQVADLVRVRSLSIQEAPFRSCLGGDCSSRTYFDKALDPNFIYFTLTDQGHYSSGHLTLVLGTAKNLKTGEDVKVAFADKLQNVSNQQMPMFLESVRRSVEERGYKLVFPKVLQFPEERAGHGGLSNYESTMSYVQSEILPQSNQELMEFVPHPNSYNFENKYSRAYKRLDVLVIDKLDLTSEVEVKAGKVVNTTKLEETFKVQELAKDFLALKESKNVEDLMKFISSYAIADSLSKFKIYSREQFLKDLEVIRKNPELPFEVRKKALYEVILNSYNSNLVKIFSEFTEQQRTQIISEIKQWVKGNDSRRKNYVQSCFDVDRQRLFGFASLKQLVNLNVIDVNHVLSDGENLLIFSIEKKIWNLAETILNRSDFKFINEKKDGSTMLHLAIMNHSASSLVAKILNRPDFKFINEKQENGFTALRMAFNRLSSGHDYEGSIQNRNIIELLLKHPNIKYDSEPGGYPKTTILIQAMERGVAGVDKIATLAGIDTGVFDGKQAEEILMTALQRKKFEIAKRILNNPTYSPVDIVNSEGKNALNIALEQHQYDILLSILSYPNLESINHIENYNGTILHKVLSQIRSLKEDRRRLDQKPYLLKIVDAILNHPNFRVINHMAYEGTSAVEFALIIEEKEIAEKILKHPQFIGVNKFRSGKGKTLLEGSTRQEDIDFLKSHGAKE